MFATLCNNARPTRSSASQRAPWQTSSLVVLVRAPTSFLTVDAECECADGSRAPVWERRSCASCRSLGHRSVCRAVRSCDSNRTASIRSAISGCSDCRPTSRIAVFRSHIWLRRRGLRGERRISVDAFRGRCFLMFLFKIVTAISGGEGAAS